ncbi:MAG TPA: hypothetical protein PLF59_08270 [Cyclobacteriaceae bacterium]|nr:hypothetical protein [Cyclobacteriaceae bacterium]
MQQIKYQNQRSNTSQNYSRPNYDYPDDKKEQSSPESISLNSEFAEVLSSISKLITQNDLSALTNPQRLKFYDELCLSLKLNPLTRPFEFIELPAGNRRGKKLTLYANKGCAEQLRSIHKISLEEVRHTHEGGLHIVTVYARQMTTNRKDFATGVVPYCEPETIQTGWDANNKPIFSKNPKAGQPLPLNEMANVIMKTETKAKRRATLSICGLGAILDETELETIPLEKNITPMTPEIGKPEDYKVTRPESKPEPKAIKYATAEQIGLINSLATKLQRGDGYVKKLLKAKLGHEEIEKVPQEFMNNWINKLNTDLEGIEKFKSELDDEEKK